MPQMYDSYIWYDVCWSLDGTAILTSWSHGVRVYSRRATDETYPVLLFPFFSFWKQNWSLQVSHRPATLESQHRWGWETRPWLLYIQKSMKKRMNKNQNLHRTMLLFCSLFVLCMNLVVEFMKHGSFSNAQKGVVFQTSQEGLIRTGARLRDLDVREMKAALNAVLQRPWSQNPRFFGVFVGLRFLMAFVFLNLLRLFSILHKLTIVIATMDRRYFSGPGQSPQLRHVC